MVRKSHTKTGSMTVESPEISSATMNIETNSHMDEGAKQQGLKLKTLAEMISPAFDGGNNHSFNGQ